MRDERTIGEKAADVVARFGGSWIFVFAFMCFMAGWIVLQLVKPFDPYPFILLNLILSTIAALQAPIIMMSQNRQATKDRNRDEIDHEINMRTEKIVLELLSQIQSAYSKLNHQLEALNENIEDIDETFRKDEM